MWVNRNVKDHMLKAVSSRPAVLLTGARQTGKSSLLKKLFPEDEYITFDHLKYIDAAKSSPEDFLSRFKKKTIFDEIQYVPELFNELKICIDENRSDYGKWILTGSQKFELMQKVSESLAGRISIIHLETLSAAELRNSGVDKIDEYIWKGGYPELWSNENIETGDFFESYIRTYIERDLRSIIDVKNLNDFRRLLKVAASRIGQLINYKDISNSLRVSDVTVRNWLHALEISGVIYLLPPYYANIGKRFIKSPKLYFADHGLASYLLGITNKNEWRKHIYQGNIWENLVVTELIKNHALIPGENIFYYRDHNGVEIDIIVERESKLDLIECKVGERLTDKKLNFRKVAPLLKDIAEVKCHVAHIIGEKDAIKLKDYYSFNPLYCDL